VFDTQQAQVTVLPHALIGALMSGDPVRVLAWLNASRFTPPGHHWSRLKLAKPPHRPRNRYSEADVRLVCLLVDAAMVTGVRLGERPLLKVGYMVASRRLGMSERRVKQLYRMGKKGIRVSER
jgi:hypothetical protein